MPTFAWIGLTSQCNLKCSHCQRMHLIENNVLKPQEMPEFIFDKLYDQLFIHLKRIQFGGNNFGEPLMAPNWDNYFARVSELGIRISLVTNGKLLTSERIRTMVDAGVEFNFSLESVTPQSYERVRGIKFENFLNTVKETCQQKAEKKSTAALVNLGFTICYDNISEIKQLIPLASSLGVDRITVTHFVPWKESQRQQSLVYHKKLSNEMLATAKRMAVESKLILDLPKPFRLNEDNKDYDNQQDLGIETDPPCNLPWTSVSINEQGDVMPCCAASVVMGNLKNADFTDIWHAWKYKKIRCKVNSPEPLVFCRNCALRAIKIGSNEPLSFCSDERILLGCIGTEFGTKSISGLRTIRKKLLKTRWGKKLTPFLTEMYRKHIAFYT